MIMSSLIQHNGGLCSKTRWIQSKYIAGGGDLLYFLHVVPERQFDVIGGDVAETFVSEDTEAEQRVVPLSFIYNSCITCIHSHVCRLQQTFDMDTS